MADIADHIWMSFVVCKVNQPIVCTFSLSPFGVMRSYMFVVDKIVKNTVRQALPLMCPAIFGKFFFVSSIVFNRISQNLVSSSKVVLS